MSMLLALALAAQTPPPAAPAPATPAPAAPAAPQFSAQMVAGYLQTRLPMSVGPGTSIVGAAGEGNLLILTVELPEAGLADGVAAASSRISTGFCSNAQARMILAGPLSLRTDFRTSATAAVQQGATVEDCPEAPAAAPAAN